MRYSVNDRTIEYHAAGEVMWGRDEVLLHAATDLTHHTSWASTGFTIETLFDKKDYEDFSLRVNTLLIALWKEAGLPVNDTFPLDQYHTLVHDFEHHLRAINKTKLLTTDKFPGGIEKIEKRISASCGVPLVALNPFDGQSVFHFRIIRPGKGDNNPLHRDIWLEDYDDCINLYIPIAGSNEKSSLILIPGSHQWPESKIQRTVYGADIQGIRFNVPAVTDIQGDYEIKRPSPGANEVLIFSPYLVHGGAVNLNEDQTRISIELRLWKK